MTRARDTIDALHQQSAELDAAFKAETAAAAQTHEPATETLESIEIRPTRANINVRLVALVWVGVVSA